MFPKENYKSTLSTDQLYKQINPSYPIYLIMTTYAIQSILLVS